MRCITLLTEEHIHGHTRPTLHLDPGGNISTSARWIAIVFQKNVQDRPGDEVV